MGCAKPVRHRTSVSRTLPVRQHLLQPGKTILLVEDEDFVRKVTSEVLRAWGFRVIAVANAQEAMETFCQHREQILLVLTDLVMPGSNGRKLAHDLRDLAPGICIILTSGYPEGETVDNSFSKALHYLPKPYSAEALITKVHHVMAENM